VTADLSAGVAAPTALTTALRALGVDCGVEAFDRLAVLTPHPGVLGLDDRATRQAVVRLAREHGFTNVAVELPPAGA
jgi:hypothetical protein